MKKPFKERFVDFADWVSEFIGGPSNISFWLIATTLYIALGPYFAQHQLLPNWFISNNFNFPLNTVTTLLELFIGFLLAAAANRSQRKLEELLKEMDEREVEIENLEKNVVALVNENTDLTNKIHSLMTEVHERLLVEPEEES